MTLPKDNPTYRPAPGPSLDIGRAVAWFNGQSGFLKIVICFPVLFFGIALLMHHQTPAERARSLAAEQAQEMASQAMAAKRAANAKATPHCAMTTGANSYMACDIVQARPAGEPDYEKQVMQDQILRDDYRRRFGD